MNLSPSLRARSGNDRQHQLSVMVMQDWSSLVNPVPAKSTPAYAIAPAAALRQTAAMNYFFVAVYHTQAASAHREYRHAKIHRY